MKVFSTYFVVALQILLQIGVAQCHKFVKKESKILLLSPFAVPSHNILFEAILEILASTHPEDYQLTYVTNSERKFDNEFENVRMFRQFTVKEFMESFPSAENAPFPFVHVAQFCRQMYANPDFVKLMARGQYDLIIVNGFIHECLFGSLHLMETPFIVFTSTLPPSYVTEPTGNFMPFSIAPVTVTSFSDRMTFTERLQNLGKTLGGKFFVPWIMMPTFESVYYDQFGRHLPRVSEIMRNASLIISNSHFSILPPRPVLPDFIEIGGIHCREGRELPHSLDRFISESENGVILLAFGSMIKWEEIQESFSDAMIAAIASLEQRIIWRLGKDLNTYPEHLARKLNTLKNVMFLKNVPQQDILAHSNVKLFISHGGMLSVMEAVYHAVPILAVPLGMDQKLNMRRITDFGSGIALSFKDVTNHTLTTAISEVIGEHNSR
ncbi:2-hydroxyacylsphingosine 1-beta-galactosyltransferase isoform X3 [Folsomia candida]|uniref:2-hydroxyacylsphingosine 1-beta-galactosyltransferase isoform X3 n=1 Tax=Folsomia candida TaxID=158441 RepID=UPI00160544BE|nr:2-hydroxyacylsphingosine 1-beta-galactosyltransferase isoform X3 [Folsomia candida]